MKKLVIACLSILLIQSPILAASHSKSGVISLRACLDQSKEGQKAKELLETMSKQMSDSLEQTEKDLETVTNQLSDEDFMEGASEDKKKELQDEYQTKLQEREGMRAQFSQQMNQTQMIIMQQIFDKVGQASEKLASQKGLDFVMQEDAVLYYSPNLDVTKDAIAIMDEEFEKEKKEAISSEESEQDN